MQIILIVAVVGLIACWVFLPWKSVYYVDSQIIDTKTYGDFNIFKNPFRKIYRNRVYSNLEYDIFCLKSVNRFRKITKYVLTNLDDEPEVIQKIKENQNG